MSSIYPDSSATTHRGRGFTLIEVVLAIVLLMFVTMSLMSIFAQGNRYRERSKDHVSALFLAQYGIEDIIESWPLSSSSEVPISGYPRFKRYVTVTHNYGGNSNLDLVNSTVSWEGETGTRNVTITTLISNYSW
ncbi:MAG: type IV pilus modification PilV family protein [Deltaproteobacteria bacterium]